MKNIFITAVLVLTIAVLIDEIIEYNRNQALMKLTPEQHEVRRACKVINLELIELMKPLPYLDIDSDERDKQRKEFMMKAQKLCHKEKKNE